MLGRLEAIHGVLEIGPGPGVLTGPISARVDQVIAIEIDELMVDALKESAPKAHILKQNALESNLPAILIALPEPCAVVSNLPYYITAPLVTKIAEAREHYTKAVLMMQKEVARRFMATPGDAERGSISVYLQALFAIMKVADVPAGAFLPPPKVESTIIELVPNGRQFREEFFALVRSGFRQPRKTLANNLLDLKGKTKDDVHAALRAAGLLENVRPHQLTEAEWLSLYKHLF